MYFKVSYLESNNTANHMLIMFFLFRNESDLKAKLSRINLEKFLEPTVTEVVNKNRKAWEPFADAVNKAFIGFIANPRGVKILRLLIT